MSSAKSPGQKVLLHPLHTRQASENQQQFVVFCRGADILFDQKHQSVDGGSDGITSATNF